MKNKKTSVVRFALAKMGLTLVTVLGLGLAASAAPAQGISLRGLKDAIKPQAQSATPSEAKQSPPSAAQGNGSTVDQQTGASAAAGSEGTISFPGKTMTGTFVHDPDNGPTYSLVYGNFFTGGADDTFAIHARGDQGSHIFDLKIQAPLAALSKPPVTRSFERGSQTAEMEYSNVGASCSAIGGTVTITAFGGVDGTVTGTMSGIKWGDSECSKQLGTSGSFTVKRSADYRRR